MPVYHVGVISVGIIGASGYTGAELLRLCARHPDLHVELATGDSQAGNAIADVYPSLAAGYRDRRFDRYERGVADGLDLVFLGLPHGASQAIVPELRGRVAHIVDLAADFRLKDAALYSTWYHDAHTAPELLADFAFGLPELFRPTLQGAEQVLSTGRDGSATIRAQVLFTPHLAPMNRGILATCYARPTGTLTTDDLLDHYRAFYADEPFVVVDSRSPSTKATLGSNSAHLTVRVDERTGWVVAIGALDNLTKGASGQALQCANLALGLDETTGLDAIGVYP